MFAAHALQGLIASGYFLERIRDTACIRSRSSLADLAWQMGERMIAEEPFNSPEIELSKDCNICAIEPSKESECFLPYAKASGLTAVTVWDIGDPIDFEKYNHFVIFNLNTYTWLKSKGVDPVKVYLLSHPGNGSVEEKRKSWEKILHIMKIEQQPISEKQRNYFLD